jgi:hypothetical protein
VGSNSSLNGTTMASESEMRHQRWIKKEQLDLEESETANIERLERNAKNDNGTFAHLNHGNKGKMERPALRPSSNNTGNGFEPPLRRSSSSERFKDLARRARLMLQVSRRRSEGERKRTDTVESRKNRMYMSLRLLTDKNFAEEDNEDNDDEKEDGLRKNAIASVDLDDDEDVQLPLMQTGYGSVNSANIRKRIKSRECWKLCSKRLADKFSSYCCGFWDVMYNTILQSLFVCLGIPMFILSWAFYYWFDNPEFPLFQDFFGAKITCSWWFNFIGRQVTLLELSRFTQWCLLDCFILANTRLLGGTESSRITLLGPYITSLAIQSYGAPFILWMWAIYDMFLLRGSSKFHNHWLYWTCTCYIE